MVEAGSIPSPRVCRLSEFTSLISHLALINSCLKIINYGSRNQDDLWLLSYPKKFQIYPWKRSTEASTNISHTRFLRALIYILKLIICEVKVILRERTLL